MLTLFIVGFIIFTIIFIFYSRYLILMYLIPRRIYKAKELLEKDKEGAIKILSKVLEYDRGNPEANWCLAELYIKQKQYILAQMYLNDILQYGRFTTEIDEVRVRETLAHTYQAMGENIKALSQYYLLQKHNKLTFQGMKNAIKINIDNNDFKSAYILISQAQKLYPNDGELYYFEALINFYKANFRSAESKLKKAIEYGLNSPECYILLAKVYFISKKFKLALDYLSKLPEDYLNSIEVENMMGQCFYYIKNYNAAIDTLEKLVNQLRLNEKLNPESLYILGCAYEANSEIEKALEIWNELVEKFPYYIQAKEKINFYQNVIKSKKLKEFIVSPLTQFIKASEKLIESLNFVIKNCVYVDEKNLEYICLSQKDLFSFNLYLIHITRNTVPISASYINQKLLLLPRYRAKHLIIVAPFFSEDSIKFSEVNSVFIYKFDIYEKYNLI